MYRAAVVVIDGIAAQQINQERVKLGDGNAMTALSHELLVEGNYDISLTHHLEYFNDRLFGLGIVPPDIPVIFASPEKRAVHVCSRETKILWIPMQTERK
jgi:hypothetical protein